MAGLPVEEVMVLRMCRICMGRFARLVAILLGVAPAAPEVGGGHMAQYSLPQLFGHVHVQVPL